MSVQDAELGWFAGLLEGEGCITFFEQRRSRGGKDIICGLQISNCDLLIINKLTEILKQNNLSWYVREKKVYKSNHSQSFYIECRQQEMIKKSLDLFTPYMYGLKKAKAQLVLDYLNKRIERSKSGGKYNTRYTEDDFSMIPRGHTLSTPRREDMVHTTQKCVGT